MKIPGRLEPLIDEGLIDDVICQLMSGKEAMVYMVQCGEQFRCAKVYKDSNKHNFRYRPGYVEGRNRIRNNRSVRAIVKGDQYDHQDREECWQSTEIDMLCRLRDIGLPVPEFYSFFDGVLLMELITDTKGNVAPRLCDLTLTAEQARACHAILVDHVVQMLCIGIVHGDLSPYNVLMGSEGPVIIDLLQAIQVSDDGRAHAMIKRDIDHMTAYFSRFAPELAQYDFAEELWSCYQHGKLQRAHLSGIIRQPDKPVNIGNLLQRINTAVKKEIAWQRHRENRWNNYLSHC